MDEIKNLAGAADATASAPEAAPAPAEAEEKLENAVAAEAPETSAAPVSVSFTGTQPERLLTFQKMMLGSL